MTALTTLSVPARPEEDAKLAATAVAADGLGHLAPAPRRADRRGRAARRAGGVPVDRSAFSCTTPTPPRPPATRQAHLPAVTWISDFNEHVRQLGMATRLLLQVVPALIGAFVGAPVLAREFETGTFRYAWTQGFGRWRWTLAKLVALAVVVAAAAGALSVLFSWYYQPYFIARRLYPTTLSAPPGRSTYAEDRVRCMDAGSPSLSAPLAGMLIRRVVPAIVTTLAAYAGLAFVVGMFLRQHYLTPLVTTNPNVSASAMIMSQWGTKGGKLAWTGALPPFNLLPANCPPPPPPGPPSGPKSAPTREAFLQCLPHGYTAWTSYQPVSRFWSFQFIEGGWLLALSLLLLAATVWLVRRRAV